MQEYIIATKSSVEKKSKLTDALGAFGEKRLQKPQDSGHVAGNIKHIEATTQEAEDLKKKLGNDHHIEPIVKHSHWREDIKKNLSKHIFSKSVALKRVTSMTPVTVEGAEQGKANEALYGSNVAAIYSGATRTTVNRITDKAGHVEFDPKNNGEEIGIIWTSPAGLYWSMLTVGTESAYTMECPIILNNGPFGWWQELLGLSAYNVTRGKGMRIGILDTGLGPNPCLDHVTDLGSLIKGEYNPNNGEDVDNHGSIVAGLIAARPQNAGQYGGICPGAEVFSLRVFTADGSGANQGDVALGIRMLVDQHNVDLINLSLTSATLSKIEEEAIQYAYNQGTVCVCAAGNQGSHVMYPAAFSETISVGALGLSTWGPEGSVAKALIPRDKDRISEQGYYIPLLSNFGPKLDCVAPGVGLISTFPDHFNIQEAYGDDTGTSLATPMVTGLLACMLENDQKYKQAKANSERSEYVKEVLLSSCSSLGLNKTFEGKGVPRVKNLH